MKTVLQVPSDLRFMPVVENWLVSSLALEMADKTDLAHLVPRFRLALVEAYSNVVRHAHAGQPELPICLHLHGSRESICLEIWDQGSGYDLVNYRTPSPEDHQEGGYGWMILHRLMDRVSYQLQAKEGYNCLQLWTFLVPIADGETAVFETNLGTG